MLSCFLSNIHKCMANISDLTSFQPYFLILPLLHLFSGLRSLEMTRGAEIGAQFNKERRCTHCDCVLAANYMLTS